MLCCLVLSIGLSASDIVLAKILEGGVMHSEELAPAETKLRPGAVFHLDAKLGAKAYERNTWFEIPKWMAGTWRYEFQTTTHVYNYQTTTDSRRAFTLRDSASRLFGHQVDSAGHVWQFDQTPYIVTSDGGDCIAYTLRKEVEPVQMDANNLTLKFIAQQIRVNKRTGVIQSTNLIESLQTYSLGETKQVTLNFSEKIFDVDGKPKLLRDGYASELPVAKFAVTDNLDGHDLRALFEDFLRRRKEYSEKN
jgi:hypothetical protein